MSDAVESGAASEKPKDVEDNSQEIRDMHFFKVFDDYQLEYIVIAYGEGDTVTVGKMAAFQLQNLLVAYKEHFDKDKQKVISKLDVFSS